MKFEKNSEKKLFNWANILDWLVVKDANLASPLTLQNPPSNTRLLIV